MAELDSDPGAEVRIDVSADATGTPTVTVSGDLDMSNADALKAAVDSVAAKQPERVVIDVSGVRFMDSAGIAVFVDAASKVPSVHLRDPSPAVRRVVEITGLTAMITMEP